MRERSSNRFCSASPTRSSGPGLSLGAALLLVSCGPAASPQASTTPGGTLPDAIRATLCASPCGGPHASIKVFRDAGRRIGALRFDGDPGKCSHPPSSYHDARGHKLVTIPMKPLTVGSPEHRRALALHSRHTKGLHLAETALCKTRSPDSP